MKEAIDELNESGRKFLLYANGLGNIDNGGTPEAYFQNAWNILRDETAAAELDMVLNRLRDSE